MDQKDADGRLLMHFRCWQTGTSVRLQGTPPASLAPGAFNAGLISVKVVT